MPDPNPAGNHEQRVLFRFLRVLDGKVTKTVFYDTYVNMHTHLPALTERVWSPWSGAPQTCARERVYMHSPGLIAEWGCVCPPPPHTGPTDDVTRYEYDPELTVEPSDFYVLLAQQHLYWEETFRSEGAATFELPGEAGALLVDQAKHSLIKDMITRLQVQWPRYGVCGGQGGCAYGDPKNNGFQEIFTASLATALEVGLYPYAKLILTNYLQFYLRGTTGLVYYRGFEMAQAARSLTLIAQYVQRTGDAALALKYFDKIQGTTQLLMKRRATALLMPRHAASFGMPTGNDEADLFRTTANVNSTISTELPFFSIATEFWRGLTELGAVWMSVGEQAGRTEVVAAGERMVKEAATLYVDLMLAMNRSVVRTVDSTTCWPYVAGSGVCDEISKEPSNRDSEPWRTYSEM